MTDRVRVKSKGGQLEFAAYSLLLLLGAACAATPPRYHYSYVWKGGALRGVPIRQGDLEAQNENVAHCAHPAARP